MLWPNEAFWTRSVRRQRTSSALIAGSDQVRTAIMIENHAVLARLSLCPMVAKIVGSAL